MNVEEMVIKYGLKPRGVIQVGSHHGEEVELWKRLRVNQVHFEPVRSNYIKLMSDHRDIIVHPVALGDRNGTAEMFCETVNGGQSNSVMEPVRHLEILPWIEFNTKELVVMCRLDEFQLTNGLYNFMFIDAQGYEMEVLNGGRRTLEFMDFLFVEVNRTEVFKGCAQIEDMDWYLGSCGFKRVETEWHGGDFGDALYVRA